LFLWAVGPAHVREELGEQGTKDEDLVPIVPQDEFASDREAKSNKVDTRSTKQSKDERST